jgi:hypothetical protein
MLNPNASVNVAEPVSSPAARPARVSNASVAPVADKAPPRVPGFDLAADVVGKFHRERQPKASEAPAKTTQAVSEEGRVRRALERAMTIKRRFGLLVACSYLREQGWNFEAAHRILIAAREAPHW